jgi:hypothetical protein
MCRDAGFEAIRVEAVGRTVTLDRLSFYFAKFLGSQRATKAITSLSDFLLLNKIRPHINLHDMMRLYLQMEIVLKPDGSTDFEQPFLRALNAFR